MDENLQVDLHKTSNKVAYTLLMTVKTPASSPYIVKSKMKVTQKLCYNCTPT